MSMYVSSVHVFENNVGYVWLVLELSCAAIIKLEGGCAVTKQ